MNKGVLCEVDCSAILSCLIFGDIKLGFDMLPVCERGINGTENR